MVIQRNFRGFTLLEILIALTILAITGTITVIGLQSAIRSQSRITQRSERLAEVQSAILILERDIVQMVKRPILTASGSKAPAFLIGVQENSVVFEFSRMGFVNPFELFNRSTLKRVMYVWDNDSRMLMRIGWQGLDRAINTGRDTQILLKGVTTMSVNLYSLDKVTNKLDPNPILQFMTPKDSLEDVFTHLPKAIEVKLNLEGVGLVVRMIPIPG